MAVTWGEHRTFRPRQHKEAHVLTRSDLESPRAALPGPRGDLLEAPFSWTLTVEVKTDLKLQQLSGAKATTPKDDQTSCRKNTCCEEGSALNEFK